MSVIYEIEDMTGGEVVRIQAATHEEMEAILESSGFTRFLGDTFVRDVCGNEVSAMPYELPFSYPASRLLEWVVLLDRSIKEGLPNEQG